MSSIFKKQKDYAPKPNRNNFDLSFTNNFTTKLGQNTPVLCMEVDPGDRFNINFAAGLRFMPLVFPVQTPMVMKLSFFYVRYRTIWKDFMDFYGRTKDNLVEPYISIPYTRADEIGTGTLADYLGVPTTYSNENQVDRFTYLLQGASSTVVGMTASATTGSIESIENTPNFNISLDRVNTGLPVSHYALQGFPFTIPSTAVDNSGNFTGNYPVSDFFVTAGLVVGQYSGYLVHTPKLIGQPGGVFNFPYHNMSLPYYDMHVIVSVDDPAQPGFNNSRVIQKVFSGNIIDYNGAGQLTINDAEFYTQSFQNLLSNGYYVSFIQDNEHDLGDYVTATLQSVSTADVSATSNPFCIQSGQTVPDIRLNAKPFRAYEAIMNAFYRNQINDPFILNGVAEYNRYVTNLDGGADSTTPLNLVQHNYELDMLTSCVTSPQQGVAPLVGVSSTGVFTFEDSQGQQFTLTPKIGPDGDTLTGIDSYDPDLPAGSVLQLSSLINHGISISDFRNVNSLQRWLESNIRRGLKFRDQIFSHFHVHVGFDELDMPEYLGGITRNISVTQVTSTAETSEMKLGDYAGQASLFTQNTHAINKYFDEPGLVMAICTVLPIPNYSQLLKNYFIKDNQLSYYFPEFSKISYQPIDYRVCCPIQAKLAGKPYTDTFGYNRPNVDKVACYDENHGLFRTDLQGFLITRNFGAPPQLGADFLRINPDSMTNPFVDTSSDSDTILGQIYFDVKAKRPIPKIVIPSLE